MSTKNETQTGLAAEIRIVPTWAWVLAGILFIAMQILFNGVLARLSGAPPAVFLALLGLVGGALVACATLLIAYINRDSKRRGMSPLLWTIVAIIIPNALGIVLYFLVRQPLRNTCPQCGNAVETEFSYCPRCSYRLSPSCSQCHRLVGVNDAYCPHCGSALRSQGVPGTTT